MKIVLDTNIFLAALFSRKGASNRLLVWIFTQKEKHNVISNTLLTEIEDVLLRDKNIQKYHNLSKKDIESFLDDICLVSYHQKIHFLWRPFLKDSNDDMVLEVAVNSQAEAIVTFNPKDFKGVEEKFDIQILSPKEFLIRIGEM